MKRINYPLAHMDSVEEKRLAAEGRKRVNLRVKKFAKAMEALSGLSAQYREVVQDAVSSKAPELAEVNGRILMLLRETKEAVHEGKLSHRDGWLKISAALKELEKFRRPVAKIIAAHRKMAPSVEDVAAILRKSALDDPGPDWSADGNEFGHHVYRLRKPDETGQGHDPLPGSDEGDGGGAGPQPLTLTLAPPFERSRVDQGSSLAAKTRLLPYAGAYYSIDLTSTVIAGGAGGSVMWGGEIQYPAGFSTATITAQIDWNIWALAIGFGGGSGSGADSVLEVTPWAGNAVRGSRAIGTVIAPVLWWASLS